MVYLPGLGSHPLTVPFKYLGQCWMTLRILWRERPTATFVMSPPLFAALTVWLFQWIHRTHLVLDCHTAAFMHPRWRRLQWLQHWLGRRSAANIVHNEHLAEVVRQKAGKAIVVKDVPVIYEASDAFEMPEGFVVAVVCSFNADEPIQSIFDAARLLPDVQFFMTGNPKHLKAEIARNRPENVALTGFLSDAAYGSLLQRAGVVMSLTTRDHTMLRGAWEAIYQGTPVVVSDWGCLRDAFSNGAQFTDNSPASIAQAINRCRQAEAQMRQAAQLGRDERLERWQRTKAEIQAAISQ